jgi:hypothetical protein
MAAQFWKFLDNCVRGEQILRPSSRTVSKIYGGNRISFYFVSFDNRGSDIPEFNMVSNALVNRFKIMTIIFFLLVMA